MTLSLSFLDDACPLDPPLISGSQTLIKLGDNKKIFLKKGIHMVKITRFPESLL